MSACRSVTRLEFGEVSVLVDDDIGTLVLADNVSAVSSAEGLIEYAVDKCVVNHSCGGLVINYQM